MSKPKLNLTGNVILSTSANHHQFVYGSQLYGTNFGVFCDFIIHNPNPENKNNAIL